MTSVSNPSVEDGDCRYLASEILAENYENLPKADILSLGLTIFILVSMALLVHFEKKKKQDMNIPKIFLTPIIEYGKTRPKNNPQLQHKIIIYIQDIEGFILLYRYIKINL